ncbi:zinc metalloproteinase nas-13 isoform X1 [Oryzias melastigma]|nr:zinc metalloproteinase nas-13 isoform X1 [Oryzias melastigma]
MQSCRMRGLLVLCCVMMAAGSPVPFTQEAVPSVPGVNSTSNSQSEGKVASELQLANASAETLPELQHDLSVAEGDILLSDNRNAVNLLWTDGIIPYTISVELANRRSEIEEAFAMIMRATCIRFQERTYENNYLDIKDGDGCASYVGCSGGAQPVYFGSTCSAGNLCHELVHAVGMYHEHTRFDRDQFIKVVWDNIKPGKQGNFDVKMGNTLNLPYDFGSIMHYGMSYFSKDGNPTIVPNQGVDIGQRKYLSRLDIQKINSLYHCGAPKQMWR